MGRGALAGWRLWNRSAAPSWACIEAHTSWPVYGLVHRGTLSTSSSNIASFQQSFQGISCSAWAGPLCFRGYCDTAHGSRSVNVKVAQDALNQVQIIKLRQELEVEGEANFTIPYARFAEIAKACGATTDAEAAQQCTSLVNAGVVMRQGNTIYLRAEEVAESVMLMLPGGRDDALLKLAKVEAELRELDQVHDKLERSSKRRTDFLLFIGLVMLFTQFVSMIWLTWWELSWDVMEPVAYIISLFYSLVAYIYFMFTRHAFDLGPIQNFWARRFKERGLAAEQFDNEKYEYLKKLQGRYQRHLRVR